MDPVRWREAFEVATGRIAGRFAWVEPRRRAGDTNPHGMRHLLCRAAWDADAVRDDVREYVVEHLHDEVAVVVVDEAGDVKKHPHCRGPAPVRSWISGLNRCRAAGLGEATDFAAKPELARVMIVRFLDAGHRVDWVTGDEVYGSNPKPRSALEERGMGYVLAVA